MEIGTKVIVVRINKRTECFSSFLKPYLGKVGTLLCDEADWQPYQVQFDEEGKDTVWFFEDEIEEYVEHKPVQPEKTEVKFNRIRNLRVEKVSDGYDVCFTAEINVNNLTVWCTIPFILEENAVRTMQKIKEQIL